MSYRFNLYKQETTCLFRDISESNRGKDERRKREAGQVLYGENKLVGGASSAFKKVDGREHERPHRAP